MEKACLESLNLIQSQGGKEGKRKVEAHIMLYVRSLWRGTGGTAPVDLMYDAKRITDVRWAAQRHPDPEVRRRAARCLGFLMER